MIYVDKYTKYYKNALIKPKKIIYFIYIDIINKNISINSNQNSNHTSYKKVNVIPSLGFHLPLI